MNMLFPISACSVSLGCIFIGLLILFYNKQSIAHRAFFLFTLSIFIWLYFKSTYVYIHADYLPTLLAERISYSGVLFIPISFYYFLLEFLQLRGNKRIIFWILFIINIMWLLILCLTPLLIEGIYRYRWACYPKSGPLNYLFVLYFISIFIYCLVIVYSSYRNAPSNKNKLQLKWIFVSFLVSFFAIGDFLPMFGFDHQPFGYLFVFAWLIATAYAILRHQFLNIEVIVKKTLIFTGIFVSIYAVFAFFAFLGQVFFERFVTANRWLSMIPSVIIVTLTLRPLEGFLINITDKYLFQKKYDYKELLKTFASDVLSVLELDKLIKLTEEKLAQIMKLEYCKVVIADKMDVKTEAVLKIPIEIASSSRQGGTPRNDGIIGMMLLGKKKSDEEYTQDDMLILQSLSNTLAIAISNANLVDELTKAQVKMAEKEKMATIGTLAAGMAHEIRNPITTIRVFSEYVPDRLRDEIFTNKYRSTITKEVDKIDHIIQTLIDFSGEEEIRAVSGVSAYEAVEELVSIIAQNKDISGRIRLVNNISADLTKISVNKEELDEVILNLTQNAIYAISGKGTITFSAGEKDKIVVVEISDTGSGMSEETIAHIFDPFFTTKSKGFGLGLFVVKELVQRNKGEISVESRVGEGTKFRLRFNTDNHK